ncbi:MAG TPA: hypothetical protein VMI73_20235 [Trebonia sp.]|nr:hypothetical protein [Trebonia sp.]
MSERTVTFRLADPEHRLAGVRLIQDVRIPGDRLGFHRGGDGWELVIDRPPVNRMEYLLELRHPNGGAETVLDPGNPRQVAGAFGPKSVLEFPGYTPPGWLSVAAAPGFEVGDDPDMSYQEKLDAYRKLADSYFEADRYHDFCATSLPHVDEIVLDWVAGPDFDRLLIDTVRSTYPAHEQDKFIAHLRGLLGLWVRDETARLHAT